MLQANELDSDADVELPLAPHPATLRPPSSSNLHLAAAAAPFVPPAFDTLSDEVMAGCLESVFGYKGFRGHQLKVVKNIMAGQSTLAILPTGDQLLLDCSNSCRCGVLNKLPDEQLLSG